MRVTDIDPYILQIIRVGGEKTYMNEIKVHSRGGNHWSVNVISVDRIEDSHLKYIVCCCAG